MARKCKRCSHLENIILDIHWMARRYADMRRSYAPGMFNRSMDEALALGIPLKEDTALNATFYADDADLGKWYKGRFVREANSKLLNDVG
jgi:hypothetical protein